MSGAQTGDNPGEEKSGSEVTASSSAGGASDRSGSSSSGSSPTPHDVVSQVVGASPVLAFRHAHRILKQVLWDLPCGASDEDARVAAMAATKAAEAEAEEYLSRHVKARAEGAERDFVRVLLEAHPAGMVAPLGGLLDAVSQWDASQMLAMNLTFGKTLHKQGSDHWAAPFNQALVELLTTVMRVRFDYNVPTPPPPPRRGVSRG